MFGLTRSFAMAKKEDKKTGFRNTVPILINFCKAEIGAVPATFRQNKI
jgi:hypothetical protein